MADRIEIQIIDNTAQAKEEMAVAVLRALTSCGSQAEKYAKQLAPVDSGNLRNSITNQVHAEEQAVYIGTTVEYGVYQEFGTGKYVAGGRDTPWAYQDAHGRWHRTTGNKPHPFIKPALDDHRQDYRHIIEHELKG